MIGASIRLVGATISSLPLISVTTTRSPTSTASSFVRHAHSSAPTIGTLKRTSPITPACGLTTIIPVSPIITLPPNPAFVRSTDNGLIYLTQANINNTDKTSQIMTCNINGTGSNHDIAATITAAAPNQRLAKVGINISAIINKRPNTSQCQGSIIQIVSIISVPSFAVLAFNVAHFNI